MNSIKETCLTGVAALLMVILPGAAHAQRTYIDQSGSDAGTWYGALTYNMAVPIGSLADFTGDFSPIGIGLDVRYKVWSEVSFGMAFAWQNFGANTTDPVTIGNATFQGKQYRWTNVVPLLVNAHYYFRDLSSVIKPFAGFNLGAYFVERRVDVGVYTTSPDTWHFGIAPEIGLGFRVGGFLPVLIFRYNHIFSSDGSGDLPYFNFNVGIAWS